MRLMPHSRGGALWRFFFASVLVIGAVAATTAVAGLLQVRQLLTDFNINPNEVIPDDHVVVGKGSHRQHFHKPQLMQILLSPNTSAQQFAQWYLRHHTLMLNGATRMNHVTTQSAGDLQAPPHSSFQVLFGNDSKRRALRQAFFDAFDSHLVVDATNLGQLRLRLSAVAPTDDLQERGIHAASLRVR